jgi:hypothetical protein
VNLWKLQIRTKQIVLWRALRPSKPPNRNKSKNFPNQGWG